MTIEAVEELILERLRDCEDVRFASVKRFAGEIKDNEILEISAIKLPAAMVYAEEVADSDLIDGLATEEVTFTVILMVSTVREDSVHQYRRAVKSALNGLNVGDGMLAPLRSIKTSAVAVTPLAAAYAMQFKCEMCG